MVYCTIEEAWSQSLNPELQNNSRGYDPQMGYYDIDLKNSQLYDSEGNKLCDGKKKKQNKRKTSHSRTYNRLPEHSGPTTRFVKDNQKVYIRSDDGLSIDAKENHPSYSNLDLPINEYNIDMYQKLNDEYLNKQKEFEKSSMIEDLDDGEDKKENKEHFQNSRENDNYLHIIKELKEENSKLRDLVNDLKNSKVEDKDSFLDLIVFVATGVIIILMMENVNKLIRKF